MLLIYLASRTAPLISPAVLAAMLLTGAGLVQSAAAGPDIGQGTVFTADEVGGTITRIDLSSAEVRSTRLPLTPHNVDVSAAAGLVFVVGVGRPPRPVSGAATMGPMTSGMPMTDAVNNGHDEAGDEAGGGLLAVFDIDGIERGPVAQIAVGHHPAHVVADHDGKRVFVTDAELNLVSVIDLGSQKVVRTIVTGRFPHGLRLSPDGRELFVANVEEGSVSVIDVTRLTEVRRISVGKAPVQVGFTPDGTHVYVSLRDEDAVVAIDRASREVVARIPVGSKPIQVYATPDGRSVYVANQGSDDHPDNRVSVIDTASKEVVETLTVGAGAHGVTISDNGRFAYVTNIEDDSVSVLDTASREVVQTIAVGNGPNGIAFFSGKR